MLLIVGTVRLPPAALDEARPHMRQLVEASRAEDGCAEYRYAEDILNPGLIHVTERWRDQAALDHHFATAHLAAWRAAAADLGLFERDLSLYEVGEPRTI